MKTVHIAGLAALMSLVGCSLGEKEATGPSSTGARLSVDYFGGSDVVGFHFEITRVACDADDAFKPFTVEANVDLVDGIAPGMVEILEQTYDADSRHLLSDFFVSLEEGCYDVDVAPASAIDGDDWTPSEDCSSASADGVSVVDGSTTEIVLISQCVGDETGALDTTVTLNHPPVICGDDGDGAGEAGSTSGGSEICDGLTIDEKYNYECEPVNACVTYYDEDDDPMEVVWDVQGPYSEFALNVGDAEVIDFQDGHRIWRQCAEIVTQYTASYDINVAIYDLGYDDGHQVRIESLVSPETSNDDLDFPVHTNWIEEPLCFDTEGDLVSAPGVEIERYPGCAYTDAETWYCDMNGNPEIHDMVCDEWGNLIESALYPECTSDC
jgi:hypothetical protein